MKNIAENAALHPNEDPSPVFRVVDGVILQVASGPVAGLTPTSACYHSGRGRTCSCALSNRCGFLDLLGHPAPRFPLLRLRFPLLQFRQRRTILLSRFQHRG